MEYVEGKLLTNLINEKEDHRLDLMTVADVMRQAAEGLAHAHAKNMVHRDIKPDNLLVTPDGQIKILDLGLARFFKTTDEESLTLKHDERVIGTADYLAPEQAIDSHSVDSRADIYGLGCTFYCALTGHPPFTEGTLVQRLMAHQTQPAPPVTNERPDVPESLVKILDRTLAKKREDRFQTGRELADELTSWLFENAPHEWKELHLPMYAALRLKDLLSNLPKPAPIEPTAEVIEATSPKPIPSVTTKKVAESGETKTRPVVTSKAATMSRQNSADPSRAAGSKVTKPGAGTASASPKPVVKAKAAKISGVVEVARRHPVTTAALSLLATAMLLAAGVYLLQTHRSASASDRSDGVKVPTKSSSMEVVKAK